MKSTILVVMLLIAAYAVGQDAQVVELSDPDAAQAKRLYSEKLAADKAWDDFYETAKTKTGLKTDVVFSKDFRFAVPKINFITGVGGTMWSTPCWTNTSAVVPAVSTLTPAPYQLDSITTVR